MSQLWTDTLGRVVTRALQLLLVGTVITLLFMPTQNLTVGEDAVTALNDGAGS